VGQKLVKFSDLSGDLITDDAAVARIVIHEHPELGGAPVEIEVLADEARAVEKAAVQVALVELYLPGDDEPRRVAMDVEAFDKLATEKTMSELLVSARPARRPVKTREKRGAGRDQERGTAEGSAGAPAATGPAKAASPSAGVSASAKAAAPAKAAPVSAAPVSAAPVSAAPVSAASLAAAGLAEVTANVA
jgi:hypothetical protein